MRGREEASRYPHKVETEGSSPSCATKFGSKKRMGFRLGLLT